MVIWLALLIPFITAFALKVFYNRHVTYWELFVPLSASIIAIFISKVVIDKISTNDTEYWGGMIAKAEYYEDWDEYIHQTCTREVPCGTDSKGNTQYCTETYDCSYVEYHPERWIIYTTSDEQFSVTKSTYEYLIYLFKQSPIFVDMHRSYHSDDGDMYYVTWDGSKEKAQPIVSQHTYENRVQCSKDVFNFPEVDSSDIVQYKLFDYPKYNEQACFLTYSGLLANETKIHNTSDFIKGQNELYYQNGIVGPLKQCRIWILLFNNPDRKAGLLQQAYWKGGNKNEMVVTIGIDSMNNVLWCYPFSWSEVKITEVNIRTLVENQKKLNLVNAVDQIATEVKSSFVRKHFREFDYLTVEPSTTAIIIVFIIVFFVNIGTSIWVIMNEFENEEVRQ